MATEGRIRPEIFDFEPDLGLKRTGAVPTNRHTTIPNDSGPISVCFGDYPKLQPFLILAFGLGQELSTKWFYNWSTGLILGALCTIFRA